MSALGQERQFVPPSLMAGAPSIAEVANLTAVPHDSLDPADWRRGDHLHRSNVNPNLGTAVGSIRSQQSNVSAAGSGGAATPVEWDFVAEKPVYLRSASEGLYLNFNGATLPAGTVLNIFISWTEENTNT